MIDKEKGTDHSTFRQEMRETDVMIPMHMANEDTFQVLQSLPGVVRRIIQPVKSNKLTPCTFACIKQHIAPSRYPYKS
jgi:hypothetical protein